MWYAAFAVIIILIVLLTVFFVMEAKASKGTAEKAPDTVILLGYRVTGDRPAPILMMRIEKAARYLKENKGTDIIVCGGIVNSKEQFRSEAEIMYDGLVSLGVEKERIIFEDKSRTTVENFLNAKKIIEEKKGDRDISLAILSSDFHLMRARVIAKRCGLSADTIPAPSPKNERVRNYIRELLAFPLAYIDTKGVK